LRPIESIIADYLKEYPALKAIHNGRACQGTAEDDWEDSYIAIHRISNPPEMKRLGIPTPRIQVDCFSKKYGEAVRMSELVYEALDGFCGVLNGVEIEHIGYEDYNYDYEYDTELHKAQNDFMVMFKQ
jgi:hypothetical protein